MCHQAAIGGSRSERQREMVANSYSPSDPLASGKSQPLQPLPRHQEFPRQRGGCWALRTTCNGVVVPKLAHWRSVTNCEGGKTTHWQAADTRQPIGADDDKRRAGLGEVGQMQLKFVVPLDCAQFHSTTPGRRRHYQ